MLRSPRPRRYRGLARAASVPVPTFVSPCSTHFYGRRPLSIVITVAVRALGMTLMTLLRAAQWRDMMIRHDCPSRRDQRADAPVERLYRRGVDAAASGSRR